MAGANKGETTQVPDDTDPWVLGRGIEVYLKSPINESAWSLP